MSNSLTCDAAKRRFTPTTQQHNANTVDGLVRCQCGFSLLRAVMTGLSATIDRTFHPHFASVIMENWRRVWRNGFAKVISTKGLIALRDVIQNDDQRLCRGTTAIPAYLGVKLDPIEFDDAIPPKSTRDPGALVEYACAVGVCGWLGEGKQTVGELAKYFVDICNRVDGIVHNANASAFFTNWFDYTPSQIANRELLHEVNLELSTRTDAESAA